MSKKAKIITFSVLAALLVVIITVTLLLALLPSGKSAELEPKPYDDFRAAIGDYRIVSEGGQVYVYKNGARVSRGYYDITVLGFDRGIKERDSEIFFGVRLNAKSGLGIMNKKGKLVTSADKNNDVFGYGAFESLVPLVSEGFDKGKPFTRVEGFLGKTKEGKFCYISSDGSKTPSVYDEATLLSGNESEAFIGKTTSGGNDVYSLVAAGGSIKFSGSSMPDYSEGFLQVDNKFYHLNGDFIGTGAKVTATDGALVYREESSKKLVLADLMHRVKTELSQEATFGTTFDDGFTVLEAGKYSFYPASGLTGLSSPLTGYDRITFDAAAKVYTGEKTDKLYFWRFKTETGSATPALEYVATGLPNVNTQILSTKDGEPYVCHIGWNFDFYSNNKKLSSVEVGTGTLISNADGLLVWESDGSIFLYSVLNNAKIQCLSIDENIMAVKNDGRTDYYAAPPETLALNNGDLDAFVLIGSLPESELFTAVVSKQVTASVEYFAADYAASLFRKCSVKATVYEIVESGETEYMLTLTDGNSVFSLKIEGERGNSLSVAEGALIYGKTIIKPRVEAGKLVGCDAAISPLSLKKGQSSIAGEKTVSRIIGTDEYGKYGAVDENGDIIISALYDSLTFTGEVAVAEKNEFFALLDPNGVKKDKLLTDFIYSFAEKREGFIVMRRAVGDVYDIFGFDGKTIAENVIEVGATVYAEQTYGREIDLTDMFAMFFPKNRKIAAFHIPLTDAKGKTRVLTIYIKAENTEMIFN